VDPQLTQLLDELFERGREHDRHKQDRVERYRNLEPDSANLLAVLIRALAPKRLLELGTSNGYSTIWLADAARAVGAELVSVDNDPGRAGEARDNLRAAGLSDHVQLRVADAGEMLAASGDQSWDLVLLDADRPAYASYWGDLVRVLATPGLLAVDNVISHRDEVADFRTRVDGDDRVMSALAPTGAGVLLITRT
jgi:predicted O-methyltransferase YrrM